jgi:hypothetical protein
MVFQKCVHSVGKVGRSRVPDLWVSACKMDDQLCTYPGEDQYHDRRISGVSEKIEAIQGLWPYGESDGRINHIISCM